MPGGGGLGGGGAPGIGGMLGGGKMPGMMGGGSPFGGMGPMRNPMPQMPMGKMMPMPGGLGNNPFSNMSIGRGGMPMGQGMQMPMQRPPMPNMGGGMKPSMPMPNPGGGPVMPQQSGLGMPGQGPMRMPQQQVGSQMPGMVHNYLNTPQGRNLTKSLPENMQSYIKPVAQTSPQQAVQLATQRMTGQNMTNLGSLNKSQGSISSLNPLSGILEGLGLGPNLTRTKSLLGGSIANPALTPSPLDNLGQSSSNLTNNSSISPPALAKPAMAPAPTTAMSNLGQPQAAGLTSSIPKAGGLLGKLASPLIGISKNSLGLARDALSNPAVNPVAAPIAGTSKVLDTAVNATQGGINSVNNAIGDTMAKYDIGNLAGKYETSVGRGDPGFISQGHKWGDAGGISYGAYQIETNKGTMAEYLKSGDKYAKQLAGLKVNSPEFQAKWKEMAKSDPTGFKEAQFEFLANKPNGYNKALEHAKKLGWDVDNKAMQSAIFSISNQSGGWKNGIFNKAGIKPGDSIETQINKLYDARSSYFSRLDNTSLGNGNAAKGAKIKRNIIKARTVDERRDALAMLAGG